MDEGVFESEQLTLQVRRNNPYSAVVRFHATFNSTSNGNFTNELIFLKRPVDNEKQILRDREICYVCQSFVYYRIFSFMPFAIDRKTGHLFWLGNSAVQPALQGRIR